MTARSLLVLLATLTLLPTVRADPPRSNTAGRLYEEASDAMVIGDETTEALHDAVDGGLDRLAPLARGRLEAWFGAQRDALAAFRKARLAGPCRFGRDLSRGWALELPRLAPMKLCSYALAAAAERAELAGRADEARALIADAWATGDAFARDPLLISQLVRLAIQGAVLGVHLRCAGRAQDAASRSAWVALIPEPVRYDGMFAASFDTEAVMLRQWMAPGRQGDALIDLGELSWLERRSLRSDARYCVALNRELAQLASLTVPERRPRMPAFKRRCDPAPRWRHPLTTRLMPAVLGLFERQGRWQARLAVARARLRLEDGWRTAGTLPAVVERDPCSAGRLRLRRQQGGWQVYSVGPDGTDDQAGGDDVAMPLTAPARAPR